MRQSRLLFVLKRDYRVAFAVILNEVKCLKQLILSHQSIEILHSLISFRMTRFFKLFQQDHFLGFCERDGVHP